MRKVLLCISSLALLAVMGMGAQTAWAFDPEPQCSGKPDGIQGFHYLTDPGTQLTTADVYGGTALCGTEVTGLFDTIQAGYLSGFILTPGDMDSDKGVTVRCANPARSNNNHFQYCDPAGGDDLESTSYAGSAFTDLEQCVAGANNFCTRNPTNSDLYVYDAGAGAPNSHCAPVTVVQCFQSKDQLGLGKTDITVQPCWALTGCREAKAPQIPDLDPMQDRYFMTIYQIDARIPGINVYYLTIGMPDYEHPGGDPDPEDFRLCEFASGPGGSSCGSDSGRWIQKNPPAGTYGCGAGKPEGAAARAITFGGLVAPDVCKPASWTP